MVFAGASATNQFAILTGGVLGLAIAKPLSDDGCRVVLWDIDFARFDEAQGGFTPAMKQLVDDADMMRSRKRSAIPSRGCGRSIFWSITLATDRSGRRPAR
ncbi:hypothetical protein CN233_24180 [Sinorhizobium meliloti]|nr:hypothetical protein CN233_24180 [Sinorhizobium meliloti]